MPIRLDFSDHVWLWLKGRGVWKCGTCGAVTAKRPPVPTPPDWMPEVYERLTKEDRAAVKDLERMR